MGEGDSYVKRFKNMKDSIMSQYIFGNNPSGFSIFLRKFSARMLIPMCLW